MLASAILLLIVALAGNCQEINTYYPDYGVFVGEMSNLGNADISGQVYLINETSFQIINFTFNGENPDVYFWLDVKDTPTQDSLKVPTFEFGITPLGAYDKPERVVLVVPFPHKVAEFKSLSLYSFKHNHVFGSVSIPDNMKVPRPAKFSGELLGKRYSLSSGPIYVFDRRTIKIFGFQFEGDRAPDTYFFAGRGANVAFDSGVKVAIRGKDVQGTITEINENYRGGKDLILELPENYDIHHIDWISVYCYRYRVNFGNVVVPSDSLANIPPYVPVQKHSEDLPAAEGAWSRNILLGTDARRNFTFQLGTPGGQKGFKARSHMRVPQNVWYVNGHMSADIYLKRDVTYNFIVEGGHDKSVPEFYNPLYISADKYGGYNELSTDEASKVKVYSSGTPEDHAGRLCLWSNEDVNADDFATFADFRKKLQLRCDDDYRFHMFSFTANETMPDVLYYQSATNFNMGGRIILVNDFPTDIADKPDEPYTYDEWIEHNKDTETSNAKATVTALFMVVATILMV